LDKYTSGSLVRDTLTRWIIARICGLAKPARSRVTPVIDMTGVTRSHQAIALLTKKHGGKSYGICYKKMQTMQQNYKCS
jgi:hypothetical protein